MSGSASYIAWVRTQPCAVQPCVCKSEAHHATNAPSAQHDKSIPGVRRGKSQKADDWFTFPLCPKAHSDFHAARGFCEGWTKEERNAWQDEQVRIHRARYEAELEATASGTVAPSPAKAPRPTVDQEAEAFCSYHSLGSQILHDLKRLLHKLEREGVF